MKIIGGEEVEDPTAYPYQVFIEKIWNNTAFFKCGGTIYNEQYIITAGHCTYFRDAGVFATPRQMWVTAGTIDLASKDEEIRRDKQVIGVSEIHTHPNFEFKRYENDRSDTPIYDIAILKLKKPLKLTDRVAPLSIPPEKFVVKGNGTVTGWGRKELNGTIINRMRKVDIPFLELKSCKKLFKWVVHVNDDMVCTGTEEGNVTPCYGDSGGPVRCTDDQGSHYFCGVSSFNGNNCANYNVYTRVSSYIQWIRSVAGEQI
ncbi:unnamed protein product [Orchesella dallaii]|uniref:Peptidase S1 domain-containing protein n=1 Tax=Orchesella dallaii TaxID=48710 RepID=A0ABP1RCC1_9HEXA